MLSSNVLSALALFAAAVNAGPCRPSTTLAGTTTEVTSTATVIGSTTDLTSTTIESATETETTDIATTTTAIAEESTTTTAVIEESTTTEAASTTTTAAVEEYSCSTPDDCVAYPDLCLDGLLNLCVCLNAVCTPAN
ncbi:hypothetical protein FCIRC_12408 [Fusarium circinatum]|uniref:Extracellular membrane protein CFEM domain-containing protein n=1 Tax=Fusarium circinatum TaxID=48490 RepID=A0A8H5STK7_FUSCI|nr:hypothetical protein FCIRC_12408 [Fusarium circinatum]